jgi:hypothetical protein
MNHRASASSVGRRTGQRGVSLLGILVIICLAVFFGAIFFTMGPSYLSFLQVRSAMDGMREKPAVIERGPGAIRSAVADQLYINDIRSINSRQFKIEKKRDHYLLSIDYEVRKHLLLNVDVVMNFDHAVQLERE